MNRKSLKENGDKVFLGVLFSFMTLVWLVIALVLFGTVSCGGEPTIVEPPVPLSTIPIHRFESAPKKLSGLDLHASVERSPTQTTCRMDRAHTTIASETSLCYGRAFCGSTNVEHLCLGSPMALCFVAWIDLSHTNPRNEAWTVSPLGLLPATQASEDEMAANGDRQLLLAPGGAYGICSLDGMDRTLALFHLTETTKATKEPSR